MLRLSYQRKNSWQSFPRGSSKIGQKWRNLGNYFWLLRNIDDKQEADISFLLISSDITLRFIDVHSVSQSGLTVIGALSALHFTAWPLSKISFSHTTNVQNLLLLFIFCWARGCISISGWTGSSWINFRSDRWSSFKQINLLGRTFDKPKLESPN